MDNPAETIAAAARGDEAAQRSLYESYHGAASRLAYLLLSDANDAEEVVQDAFVYVLRNLRRYDAERGSFWAWLRVVLVSRSRNKRRRRQLALVELEALTENEEPRDSSSWGDDPASLLELSHTRRAVWGALQQVSSGARDALILRYYEGLPYEQVSVVLGCSAEAARARVAHGKRQLRLMLAGLADEAAAPVGAPVKKAV